MAFGGPAVWLTALVLLAAAALWLLPEQMTGVWSSRSARPPATASPPDASTRPATDPPATGTASSTPALGDSAVERTTAAPSIAPGAAASSPATPSEAPAVVAGPVAQVAAAAPAAAASGATSPPTGAVVVIADAPSWVEVVDSRGATLLSRLLQPGETVGIDGVAPFKLKVGNAGATRIAYRGQPVELAAHTRDNIARFELAR